LCGSTSKNANSNVESGIKVKLALLYTDACNESQLKFISADLIRSLRHMVYGKRVALTADFQTSARARHREISLTGNCHLLLSDFRYCTISYAL